MSPEAGLERSPGRTRRVGLGRAVRVHILYRLAEETDGGVVVHDDVYDMGMSASDEELARQRSGH